LHVWKRREFSTGFWLERLKYKRAYGDTDVDGRILLKEMSQKQYERTWNIFF